MPLVNQKMASINRVFLIPNEQIIELELTQSSEIPPDEHRQSRNFSRPSTFDWQDAMHSSLKTAVLSAKPIRVCLISDSVMRHITEFSRVNTMFTAIELTGATPRHLDRRDSETLSRRRNPLIANRKQQQH